MSENLIRRIFFTSIIFLAVLTVFVYGIAVATFNLWPYPVIKSMYDASLSFLKFGALIPENLLVPRPKHASSQRVTIHKPHLQLDGYYALMGHDGNTEKYSAWLFDKNGEHLHTWDLSYSSLDSDGPLNGSDAPHAFKVLSDGSLIVSFDKGDVLARLDQCSKPIWKKTGIYHHSLEQAEDGTFWVWRGDDGTPYGHYHYLENFDPETGASIREIGLIEDVIKKMGPSSSIFGVRPDYHFLKFQQTPHNKVEVDIFHPNDIDILHSDIAKNFERFEPGDLLLSFKNIHLVMVLDPDNKQVKWWSNGPWRYQHDPDFVKDGTISVYSNNKERGRSEILKIDPETYKIYNELYEGELFFYSAAMGKHQYLPNENVLIVVPGEGRVVEVTKNGDKVFEFNNISTKWPRFNEHIANGIWLPKNYFNQFPECPTLL